MELQELRYFIQIAKDGNYTRAASHLYVSQPALSKAMKKLEGEFRVPLLEVRPNGVFLTDYGELLYERGVHLLGEFDSLKDFVRDIEEAHVGCIRIGVTPMLNKLFLEDLLIDFSKKYPATEIKITENGNRIIRQLLQEGQIDIALCIEGESFQGLEDQFLFEDFFVVCMAETHPLAKHESLTFAQLKDESFNFFSTASTLCARIRDACKDNDYLPKINFTSSNVDQILRITAAGNGICLFPRHYAVQTRPAGIKMVPLSDPFSWVACLAKNKLHYQSVALTRFASHVTDFFDVYNAANKGTTITSCHFAHPPIQPAPEPGHYADGGN